MLFHIIYSTKQNVNKVFNCYTDQYHSSWFLSLYDVTRCTFQIQTALTDDTDRGCFISRNPLKLLGSSYSMRSSNKIRKSYITEKNCKGTDRLIQDLVLNTGTVRM